MVFLSMLLGGIVGNFIISANRCLSVSSCSAPVSLAMLETQCLAPRLITFGRDTTILRVGRVGRVFSGGNRVQAQRKALWAAT